MEYGIPWNRFLHRGCPKYVILYLEIRRICRNVNLPNHWHTVQILPNHWHLAILPNHWHTPPHIGLAGNVGDMSATCRRHATLSANFADMGCLCRQGDRVCLDSSRFGMSARHFILPILPRDMRTLSDGTQTTNHTIAIETRWRWHHVRRNGSSCSGRPAAPSTIIDRHHSRR